MNEDKYIAHRLPQMPGVTEPPAYEVWKHNAVDGGWGWMGDYPSLEAAREAFKGVDLEVEDYRAVD